MVHPKKGATSSEVQGPKLEGRCPEVSIREDPEELTLKAEEVPFQKVCVNFGHIAEERWRPCFGGR